MGTCALWSHTATATYSIVAVDRRTHQMGAAAASCYSSDIRFLYTVSPGRGGIAAQAEAKEEDQVEGNRLLMLGVEPKEIVRRLTSPDFDPDANIRQYGIVDTSGRSAGFTGARTLPFSKDLQGVVGEISFSIQGNRLTGEEVLTRGTSAFNRPACDLAEHLMNALRAASEAGAGDRRCSELRIPASTAFIKVGAEEGRSSPFVDISVAPDFKRDPVERLGDEFAKWRATHPCVIEGSSVGTVAKPTHPAGSSSLCSRCSASSSRGQSDATLHMIGASFFATCLRRIRKRRMRGAS